MSTPAASSKPNPSSERDFRFFTEIINAFKLSKESAPEDGNLAHVKVGPFLHAMTMFLRIFDAFSNPFFSDVVKKDVVGNITKLRDAAARTNAETLEAVIDSEMSDVKYAKLIKKEQGAGQNSGTVALLWMKRTMQFVCGLLVLILEDSSVTLSNASRASYAKTLRYCHNIITRGVFDTGLRFAPSRETFYDNLTGGADVGRVDRALREYLDLFQPQTEAIVKMYLAKGLETWIVPKS